MKTKQEVIQQAWGDLFEEYEDRIDSDGFLHFKSAKVMERVEKTLGKLESHRHRIYAFRPKSLAGIENNNGWIKIESEDDLPKEEKFIKCFIYKDGIISMDLLFNGKFIGNVGVTHYQPIVKPKPPLY